ncbi:hypothetical protein A3B57_03785 [Microgenomates group bacterium RIFCSPLOWO2_01_FULL_47_10]|nr:MAG: hypothetical protein A3B57_03785 [Microgenomates group bacterium RIFCSPLOWO2_01_FULL_47_10]
MPKAFSPHRVLWLVFFASLVLGQFQRLSLPGLPSVYFHEIILALLNLSVLLDRRYRPTYLAKIRSSKLWWVLCATLGLSLAVNWDVLGGLVVPAGFYLIRFALYVSLIPVTVSLQSDPFIKRYTPFILPGVLAGLAIGGVAQYLIYPDARALYWLGWDKHLYRSIGTIFDPNFLGLLMVMGIFLTPKLPAKWQWWYLSLLGLCLLLTYSRSSYLALLAGGLVLAIKKHQIKLFLLGIAAFASMLLVLPNRGGEGNRLDRVYSILNRQDSIKQALTFYRSHPIFGIGFNAYGLTSAKPNMYSLIPRRTSSPDNSYLLILSTAGLVGFAAFGLALKHLWRVSQSDAFTLALLSAVLVHALFNNSLFYPWVMVSLAVIMGTKIAKGKTSPKRF